MFGHEKFKAYSFAIDFMTFTIRIIDGLPAGNGYLAEQFKRSALSIPLNIAEGSGKLSEGDKRRFYSIARGSAMECAALLDALLAIGLISNSDRTDGKELLNAIVGILTATCRVKKSD